MKKFYIILQTVLFIVMGMQSGLKAQVGMNMFDVESFATKNTNDGLYLSWTSALVENGDVFLVEKLDANWDYIEVGKVSYNPYASKFYGLNDPTPAEGENYYRITLIKQGNESFVSDLLIADYFAQPEDDGFRFLFNDKFANYAALKNLDQMPKEVGVFGTKKYTQHSLKLRRIKADTVIISGKGLNQNMVATTIE